MLRKLILGFVGVLLLTGTSNAALLSGKTTVAGEGVAGVTVKAWPKGVLSFGGAPSYQSKLSAADGHFELELPPGQYYLIAESDKLFSYYGRNTVSVPEAGLEDVNLPMVPKKNVAAEVEPLIATGVSGRVLLGDKTVAEAVVFVYPDLTSELKGFGLGMSAPTAGDGVYEIPLTSGRYYLVARVRRGGGFAGPLKAGDLFGYAPVNPVVVEEGKVARVNIPLIEVPEKVSRLADTLFGNTRISGRVLDAENKPVAGIKVLLYADSSMLDRPLYVSQPSDAAGHFELSFPQGGTYFLAARDKLGGAPGPGELYGRYQGSPDHSLHVDSGQQLKGIEIVVEEVW